MEDFTWLSRILSDIVDGFALGVDMFGDHAIWLWFLPPIWGIAGIAILNMMQNEEEALDRAYLAKAERNLPRLKELLKQRSTEILDVRSINQNSTNDKGQNRQP